MYSTSGCERESDVAQHRNKDAATQKKVNKLISAPEPQQAIGNVVSWRIACCTAYAVRLQPQLGKGTDSLAPAPTVHRCNIIAERKYAVPVVVSTPGDKHKATTVARRLMRNFVACLHLRCVAKFGAK